MDFWTIVLAVVVAGIIFVTLPYWLAFLLVGIVAVGQVIYFLLIGWWVGLLGQASKSLDGIGAAYERPGIKWGAAAWANEHKYHKWHVAQAEKYGPNWWMNQDDGGIYNGATDKLISKEQRAEVARAWAIQKQFIKAIPKEPVKRIWTIDD